MSALNTVLFINLHIVTQIVETELVVGSVGNIGIVCLLSVRRLDVVDDQTDGQAQPAVNLAHLLRVTLCKVIVDGNDMDALSGQCVQVNRQGCYQGFTFTGFHLGDASLMQHDTTDDLNREVLESQNTPCSLTAGRKCLRQDVVQRFSVCQTLLELRGHCFQLLVAHLAVLLVERQHLVTNRVDSFEFSFGIGSEDFIHQSHLSFTPHLFQKGPVEQRLPPHRACVGKLFLSAGAAFYSESISI